MTRQVGRQWLLTEIQRYEPDYYTTNNKEIIDRLQLYKDYDVSCEPFFPKKITPDYEYPTKPTEGWLNNAILDSGIQISLRVKTEEKIKALISFGFTRLENKKV
jgi:hypothetical protein